MGVGSGGGVVPWFLCHITHPSPGITHHTSHIPSTTHHASHITGIIAIMTLHITLSASRVMSQSPNTLPTLLTHMSRSSGPAELETLKMQTLKSPLTSPEPCHPPPLAMCTAAVAHGVACTAAVAHGVACTAAVAHGVACTAAVAHGVACTAAVAYGTGGSVSRRSLPWRDAVKEVGFTSMLQSHHTSMLQPRHTSMLQTHHTSMLQTHLTSMV